MAKLRKLSDGSVYLPRRDKAIEAFMRSKGFKALGVRRWEVPPGFSLPEKMGTVTGEDPAPARAVDLPPERSFLVLDEDGGA